MSVGRCRARAGRKGEAVASAANAAGGSSAPTTLPADDLATPPAAARRASASHRRAALRSRSRSAERNDLRSPMRIPLPFLNIHIYAPGSSRGRSAQQAQQLLPQPSPAPPSAALRGPPVRSSLAPRQHRSILGFRVGTGLTTLNRALATYANAPTVSTGPTVPTLTEDLNAQCTSGRSLNAEGSGGPLQIRGNSPAGCRVGRAGNAVATAVGAEGELRHDQETAQAATAPGMLRWAAMLTALFEECSRQGIELDPFDASLDQLLSAASKVCGLYVDCFRDTAAGLNLLREGMDGTPYLSDIAPEHRPWLCIDPVVREDLRDGLSALGIDASKNPLLPLIFDNEPGYLHDMARAWQLAMTNVDQKVTSSEILRWHAAAKGLSSGEQLAFKRGAQGLGLVTGPQRQRRRHAGGRGLRSRQPRPVPPPRCGDPQSAFGGHAVDRTQVCGRGRTFSDATGVCQGGRPSP